MQAARSQMQSSTSRICQRATCYRSLGLISTSNQLRTGSLASLSICHAIKKPAMPPPFVSPEDKTLQSILETGIKGSFAVVAASALHLNVFQHLHFSASNLITGVELAAPCLAFEAILLLLLGLISNNNMSLQQLLCTPPAEEAAAQSMNSMLAPAADGSTTAVTPNGHRVLAKRSPRATRTLQEALNAVYRHNQRYSLVGVAPAGQRLLLEAAAQISEDMLLRGVLLGCSTAWLSAR
eukprot:GHRR01030380.1.p1 GENE.GHRR01030380.1~~GHRR01030380.1.p1  ORF type:complete len:238 (+),score=71.17 GHRR01030380.1:378-1091(+)